MADPVAVYTFDGTIMNERTHIFLQDPAYDYGEKEIKFNDVVTDVTVALLDEDTVALLEDFVTATLATKAA